MQSDNVNHPFHYNGSIECIDVMEQIYGKSAVSTFCKLNAFKYLWRCENKGKEIEDIEKAIWYLNKFVELNK